MMLLTACGTGNSEVVISAIPDLVEYSPEVQQLAGEELQALGPPCLPMELTPGCSALRTLVNDYKHVRDEIRAALNGG